MKEKTAPKLIKTNGEVIEVSPANWTDFKLYELQKYVDGIIDIVYIPNSELIFVVNDEGMLCKEYNLMASMVCSRLYKCACSLWGDVILCHTSMVK